MFIEICQAHSRLCPGSYKLGDGQETWQLQGEVAKVLGSMHLGKSQRQPLAHLDWGWTRKTSPRKSAGSYHVNRRCFCKGGCGGASKHSPEEELERRAGTLTRSYAQITEYGPCPCG